MSVFRCPLLFSQSFEFKSVLSWNQNYICVVDYILQRITSLSRHFLYNQRYQLSFENIFYYGTVLKENFFQLYYLHLHLALWFLLRWKMSHTNSISEIREKRIYIKNRNEDNTSTYVYSNKYKNRCIRRLNAWILNHHIKRSL